MNASLDAVWAAYTTEDGWRAWVAPHVAIDLRTGGVIETNYDRDGHIGGPGTNRLHIVHYVPRRLLTLQAELADSLARVHESRTPSGCTT